MLTNAFTTLVTSHLSLVPFQRLSRPISEYFLFTLAAQITSLPVTIYHFKRLQLDSLLANPFILPAQPAVMILGGLAVILGLLWLPLGQLLAYLAWPFVVYTIQAVELFAKIPGGSLTLGEIALPLVLLFYGLMLAWTFARPRLQDLGSLWKRSLGLSPMRVMTVLVWRAALSAPDGRLHLGKRKLDWLVVAGTGDGQLGALPRALERFPAQGVLWFGQEDGTRSARLLQEYFAESRVPVTLAQTGQSLDLELGARLQVLAVSHLLRTDRNGCIEITTDGERMWVEAAR